MSRKRVSLPTAQLSAEAAAAYDQWQRAQPTIQRARKARRLLDREFGDAVLGRLPDGRLILRNQTTLPPTDFNDYSDLPIE